MFRELNVSNWVLRGRVFLGKGFLSFCFIFWYLGFGWGVFRVLGFYDRYMWGDGWIWWFISCKIIIKREESFIIVFNFVLKICNVFWLVGFFFF